MNKEEEEAIEKFSNLMTKHFEDKKIETSDYLDYFEAITILNLIEKQERVLKTRSKEIESLYKMMSVKDDKIETLKDELKEIITEFIPKSNHEVVLRAKLIKLLGENKK